jgi:hypothetical protein
MTIDETRNLVTAQLTQINELSIMADVKIVSEKITDCQNCAHLHNSVMTIEDALMLKILPFDPCSKGVCIAVYRGVPVYDEQGLPIPKNSQEQNL